MKIYVASLSDYNAGILHGAWFDLSEYEDALELYEAIKKQVLETSPTAKAEGLELTEEYAIHDYDGIYPDNLGEYENLDYLMDIQNCLNQCATSEDEEAFCTWLNEIGNKPDYDSFETSYCGKYESKEDYTYQYIEDTGLLSDMPEWMQKYFDYEAFTRDLFLDYTMIDGYVFRDF